MELLVRDLSYLVELRGQFIQLTPLQLCARDIELVLGEVGRLPVAGNYPAILILVDIL